MTRFRLALLWGALGGVLFVVACGIDENGTAPTDSGFVDVGTGDVINGIDQDASVIDVVYDAPDLGVGETESGLPCDCVTNPPSGSQFVEYVDNMRPGCTMAYGASMDYVANAAGGPASCSCTCASPTGTLSCSCGADPATFSVSYGNSCSNTGLTLQADKAGNCDGTSQSPSVNIQGSMLAVSATPCTVSGGSCAGPSENHSIPPATSTQGRLCKANAVPTQGSCASGEVCVPQTGPTFHECITDFAVFAGACPSAYPTKVTAGTSVQDNRGCGPSTCNTCDLTDSGSCGTPQLELWTTGNNCTTVPAATIPADNTTCSSVPFGNNPTFTAAQYTISHSGSGACTYTGTYSPQGGVSLGGAFTLCCR